MLRRLMSALLVCTFAGVAIAADKTPAELAIAKAIAVLEAERDKAEDPLAVRRPGRGLQAERGEILGYQIRRQTSRPEKEVRRQVGTQP
jgi:hypothetical protein